MARKDGKDRGLIEIDGAWWVDYRDYYGKRRRKKIGLKSEARAYYMERKAEIEKVRRHPDLAEKVFGEPKKALTVAEMIAGYLPELEKQASWKDQKRYAEKWTAMIGKMPIDKVTREHGRRRQLALKDKGLAPASINRDLTFIKGIFQRAQSDGFLDKNPFASLKMLPEDNVFDRYMLEAEEARLERVMDRDAFEIVVFAMETGLRRGEQFRLAWAQVNFEDGGWLVIRKAKGNKSRSVPLTARALAILRRRYETRRSAWVFPNSTNGNPINAQNFCSRVWRPALAEAEITGLKWHHLRATLASRLAIKGQSLQAIGMILGHSSGARVTERYAHLSPESVRATISALDGGRTAERNGLRLVQ